MNYTFEFYLIGTGATGSQLLPMLTQLLNNTKHTSITLIDGDIVETKNLKNQKFLEKDINFYKSQVLAERYQRVYPDLQIKYIPEYVLEKKQIADIVKHQYSLVPVIIGCVDNIETRKEICSYVSELANNNYKYVYFDSGNGTIERNGQIVISTNVIEGFNKLPWDIYPEIKDSERGIDKALSCGAQTDKNPQNIATNIYAAANLFVAITNLVMFNTIEHNFIKFDAEKVDVVSRKVN